MGINRQKNWRSTCRLYMLTMFTMIVATPLASCGSGKRADVPETVTFNYLDVKNIRERLKAGDKKLEKLYHHLINEADEMLYEAPEKVTDGDVPPSGDPHDFFTIGKFSWPNPDTPDGLPFIRKDGRWNPDAFGDRYDLNRFERTLNNINRLTLAWYYSGDERYAAKASELLSVWFLDSATRMNPNMNNASALPGVYDGMSVGIIFTVVLIEMLDHVKLLSLSPHWNNAKNTQLKGWFTDYIRWLENSPFGQEERAAKNNHGSWYTAQLASYNLFLGDKEKVLEVVGRAKTQIDGQIVEDGSLPRELRRADGFGYSIYGLYAFGTIARCATFVGCDLWSYQTSDKRGLYTAFHFILPYLKQEKPWKWGGRIKRTDKSIPRLFGWAKENYPDAEFHSFMEDLDSELGNEEMDRLYIEM